MVIIIFLEGRYQHLPKKIVKIFNKGTVIAVFSTYKHIVTNTKTVDSLPLFDTFTVFSVFFRVYV